MAQIRPSRSTTSCSYSCFACSLTRHTSYVGNPTRSTYWYGGGIKCSRLLFRLHLRTTLPHRNTSKLHLYHTEQVGQKSRRHLQRTRENYTHVEQLLLQLHDSPSSVRQLWSTVSGGISGGLVPSEAYPGQYSSSEVQQTIESAECAVGNFLPRLHQFWVHWYVRFVSISSCSPRANHK